MIARNGDGNLDRNGGFVEAVTVDIVGEAIDAVRPCRERLACQPLAVIEQIHDKPFENLDPVLADQAHEFALAERAGRKLRLEIADHQIRQADVLGDDVEQRLVAHPAVEQLERRNPQAFLKNLGGIAGVGSRHAAADVAVMTNHHGKA